MISDKIEKVLITIIMVTLFAFAIVLLTTLLRALTYKPKTNHQEQVEVLKYEVYVVENHEDEVYVVREKGYGKEQVWVLYTEEFKYQIGDTLYVAIVDVTNLDEDLAIPYIEYLGQIIDGYSLGVTKKCNGLCCYRKGE